MEVVARCEIVNVHDASWVGGTCPFCQGNDIGLGDVYCGDCGERILTVKPQESELYYNCAQADRRPLIWTVLVQGASSWLPSALLVDGKQQIIDLERPLVDGESLVVHLNCAPNTLITEFRRYSIGICSNLDYIVSAELNLNPPLLQIDCDLPKKLFRGPAFKLVGNVRNLSAYAVRVEKISVRGELAERVKLVKPIMSNNQVLCENSGSMEFELLLDTSRAPASYESSVLLELDIAFQACGYTRNQRRQFVLEIDPLVPSIDEYLGIDFGTSGCCAAVYYKTKDMARALSLENLAGDAGQIMPSTLIVNADGSVEIGVEAENRAAHLNNSDEARVIRSLKSSIASGEVIEIGCHRFTMENLSSILLEELLWKVTKANDGKLPMNIAFALPVSFLVTKREAIRLAFFAAIGRIQDKSGIEIMSPAELDEALRMPVYNSGNMNLAIIYEPCALAFVHAMTISDREGFGKQKSHQFIVYDFGAGTLDISVMNLVKSDPSGETWDLDWVTVKNGKLSGDMIDELLMRNVWDACEKNDKNMQKADFDTLREIVRRKKKFARDEMVRALSIWNGLEIFVKTFKEDSRLELPLQLGDGRFVLKEGVEELSASLNDLIKLEVRKSLERARLAYRVAATKLSADLKGGFEQMDVVLGGRMCLNPTVQEVFLDEIKGGKIYLGAAGRELSGKEIRKKISTKSGSNLAESRIQDSGALKAALAEGAALYSYRITTAVATHGGGVCILIPPYWNKLPFDIACPGNVEYKVDPVTGKRRAKTHPQTILEAGEPFGDKNGLEVSLPFKLPPSQSPNVYFGRIELWMADHLGGENLYDDEYDHPVIARLKVQHNKPEIVLHLRVRSDLSGEVLICDKDNGIEVERKVIQRAPFNEIV